MSKKRGMKHGYRSGLEDNISNQLKSLGVPVKYEECKIKWTDHAVRTYTPDFELPNGIIIESKGRFVTSDRRKHIEIKKQYPDLDIRFVFSNSCAKLYKGAKSTYGDWCDKYDFKYADKLVPLEWIKER